MLFTSRPIINPVDERITNTPQIIPPTTFLQHICSSSHKKREVYRMGQ